MRNGATSLLHQHIDKMQYISSCHFCEANYAPVVTKWPVCLIYVILLSEAISYDKSQNMSIHQNMMDILFRKIQCSKKKVSRLRLHKMGVFKHYVKIKRCLRHANKVKENKVLLYCEADICKTKSKTFKKLFSIMSSLQTHYHYKLAGFPKQWTNIQQANV